MRQAFTLVEVLVVTVVISILTGAGINSSIQATRRKTVDQAGLKLETALHQARANALAGKKENCTDPGSLSGWGVQLGATAYELVETCFDLSEPGPEIHPKGVVSYEPSGTVSLSSSAINSGIDGCDECIVFETLGQGVYLPAATTISIGAHGWQSEIEISQSGQVKKNDLAVTPETESLPSNTPTPTSTLAPDPPTATPAASGAVLPNVATGLSCTTVCINAGHNGCAGIGHDSAATNGYVYVATACDPVRAGSCSTTMGSQAGSCAGKTARWTNCRCN